MSHHPSSSPSPSPSPSLSTRPNPNPNPNPNPRRVPPPCWTHEETLALIESYHEKWYSLRRGNLKASHWQEVADSVSRRCSHVTPSKTSVQCRHKIEKLRKRYRTEKQRALATPNRFSSAWVFFKKMDAMEKGPSSTVDSDDDDDDEEEDEDDDEDNNTHIQNQNQNQNLHRQMANGGRIEGRGDGFRFRVPAEPRSVPIVTGFAVKPKNYTRFDENPNPNFSSNHDPTPRFLNSCSSSRSRSGLGRSGGDGGSGSKREMDPVSEMVSAIRLLGEGFVKMEQMKIEMAREMEQLRMEMEMKRTEMILESQQQIVDAFAKGFSAKKKMKRMASSPHS